MKSQTLKLLVKVVCFISLCSTEPHWLNLYFSNKKRQRDEVQLFRKKCEKFECDTVQVLNTTLVKCYLHISFPHIVVFCNMIVDFPLCHLMIQ